jgi:excisionase family DNA binding protein
MSIDPAPSTDGNLDEVAFVAFIKGPATMPARSTRLDCRRFSSSDRAVLTCLAESARRSSGKIWRLAAGLKAPLSKAASSALAEIFLRMAAGDAFHLVSDDRSLSTQEAADQLGMSRQYLVRLLDRKKLPSYKVGTHRRVKLTDLRAYAAIRDKDRRTAIEEMVRLSQGLGTAD